MPNNPDIFKNNPDAVVDAIRHVGQACRFGTVPKYNLQIAPLEADTQVRGIDRSMQVRRAYAIAERENLDRFLNVEFPPLIKRLNDAIRSTPPDPRAIRDLLAAMDPINKWFCETSLRELSSVAERSDE
jgi:hypothetical protein